MTESNILQKRKRVIDEQPVRQDFEEQLQGEENTQDTDEDEYYAFGMTVCSKLRKMCYSQRIYAEHLISEVLFRGQLDNLSVLSHISTLSKKHVYDFQHDYQQIPATSQYQNRCSTSVPFFHHPSQLGMQPGDHQTCLPTTQVKPPDESVAESSYPLLPLDLAHPKSDKQS